MDNYKVIGRIGEGAHGLVLRARNIHTNKEVALKKVVLKKIDNSIPNSILREIKALQHVECDYIVELFDSFPQGLGFVLVFEYMPTGLWEILRDYENILTESQIKSYIIMLLKGVDYLHNHSIMHRDLKPANLLIGKQGILKIADLGLARLYWEQEKRPYSHQVATRWYRAPELLYGAKHYTNGVDLWAVGCIISEMFNNSPLFPGDSDIEQLAIVIRILGSPNETNWPGIENLPDYHKISFPESKGSSWEEILPDCKLDQIDLVKQFLCYQADKRISSSKALEHSYFFKEPRPATLVEMPKPVDGHRHKFKGKDYDVETSLEEMFSDIKKLISLN